MPRHRPAQPSAALVKDLKQRGLLDDTLVIFAGEFGRTVFVQGDVKVGPARFYVGARHHVPSADRQFFSPSAGFSAGKNKWRARGSAYRSFRAPTLNELYREFRQGTAVTQANGLLKPERVFGASWMLTWVDMSTMD